MKLITDYFSNISRNSQQHIFFQFYTFCQLSAKNWLTVHFHLFFKNSFKMGGLYITPNSTEMGWKRRGLQRVFCILIFWRNASFFEKNMKEKTLFLWVSSEALLCLGVATIVASFVVDVNADGSKPNIWILIGGVIMQKCVKNKDCNLKVKLLTKH